MNDLAVSALSKDGTVLSWEFAIAPFGGATNQIHHLPEFLGYDMQDIAVNRLARFSGLVLDVHGALTPYPLTSVELPKAPDSVTNVISIAACDKTFAALRADGAIISWGWGESRARLPTPVSGGLSIALGRKCLAVLRGDGHVEMWSSKKMAVPANVSDIIALDIRDEMLVFLNKWGQVIVWDLNAGHLPIVCASNITKIAASPRGFVGVREDGMTILWGVGSVPSHVATLKINPGRPQIDRILGNEIRVLETSNVIDIADCGHGGVALLGKGNVVINQQPIDRVVKRGDSTYFCVEVGGNWPIYLQWRHNGKNILGATNSIFGIRRVQQSDSGAYDVVVKGSGMAVFSRSARLSVH
jgi:hypothetical protein